MNKYLFSLLFCFQPVFAAPTTTIDYSDYETVQKISQDCDQWVKNQQFTQIEKFLKDNDNQTSKDPNGLALATKCLNNQMNKPEILQEWQKQFPQSIYPTLARQDNLKTEFFKLRGGGYINSIPQDRLQQAYTLLENGAKDLDDSKKLGTSPFWYQVRISIAFLQQDRNIFFKYLSEAINKYPNYMPIYSEAASGMIPEWGFSYQDLDNFARAGMQSSKLKEEVYTSVYKSVATPCCSNKIVAAGYFNKDLYRKGMYAILKKYPTQANYNRYAQYSCLLGDIESTKYLINQKITVYVKKLWLKDQYEYCKNIIK